MPGNVVDRMVHWQDVQEMISGYPVRRVWEIFNKMLIDREKYILGNDFGWGGWGFLMRLGHGANVLRYPDFVREITDKLDNRCALYPPYPDESGFPLLNSFSNILQYGSRKYPELHRSFDNWNYSPFPRVPEYEPEEFYKTAAAGGDDDYAFINQYQLFEKLWNFLHYFGGICIDQRGDVVQYFEERRDEADRLTEIRFFHTPSDDREYKYICLGDMYSNPPASIPETGIVQFSCGRNILYESGWMSGSFSSPWIQKSSSYERNVELTPHLLIYLHFPDFYDPDTLEPMYFSN